jgi:PAS domain S-box-containing protein
LDVTDLSRVLGRLFAAAADRPALRRYFVSIALPLLATAFTAAAFGFEHGTFFPPFGLAVVLAALYGGTRPGLVALFCSLLLNTVLLPPRFTIYFTSPEQAFQVAVFGIVGTVFAVVIGVSGQLQRKLDLERQRLAVTLGSIGDAVIATDSQGLITFMNPVAEAATGWKLGDARGLKLQQVFRIVNEGTRAAVSNPVDRVLASGQVVGLANHTLLIRKDGTEIPIDDSAAPIKDGEQLAGVVLVFRDISESKALQVAMLRAEKLASVGRLAATIAHEINNPLESLTNLLYLIHSSTDLDSIRMFAETAERELARASHVTKQSLSFARQSENRRATELAPLIREMAAIYNNRLSSKNISLQYRFRDGAKVWGNPSDLQQMISNLLVNAVDAEKEGGRINIRVTDLRSRDAVRILVSDDGTGISRADMKRLFQPFFTTKKDIGTGLGLWVCRQIAQSHGGTIRVRSRLGQGTMFAVTLPTAAQSESAGA